MAKKLTDAVHAEKLNMTLLEAKEFKVTLKAELLERKQYYKRMQSGVKVHEDGPLSGTLSDYLDEILKGIRILEEAYSLIRRIISLF